MSIIEDSAQLVKANSISGNKMNDVDVVYTLWSNLKKLREWSLGMLVSIKTKKFGKSECPKEIIT